MGLGRKLAYLAAAEAFQWLPERAVRAAQLARLRAMLRFCEREVPFYRERFREHGVRADDVRRIEDLAAFPTVTREQVVGAYPERLCVRPPHAGDHVFRTSGTSGLFMEIAYSADAHDFLDAVYGRALFATGYRPWHRIAYFWWDDGPPREGLPQRLGLMRKVLVPLDPDPRAQLAALRRIRPRYVYNFPSAMMQIARVVEREGGWDFAPDGVICHGELMPDEVRDAMRRIFGCPIWNQYGAQELNRIGWDCEAHGPMHLAADGVHLEVLVGDRPAAPGEEGEIVLTGLHNRLMPLVRYRIGDLGRVVPGPCPCGRGLPRFELTEGREDDVIRTPDGRSVGPRTLAPKIEAIGGFTQYRLVQRAPARFELRVVPDDAPEDLEARLAAVVRELLGDVAIEVVRVDGIPLNRRGKLRKIVSEIG